MPFVEHDRVPERNRARVVDVRIDQVARQGEGDREVVGREVEDPRADPVVLAV